MTSNTSSNEQKTESSAADYECSTAFDDFARQQFCKNRKV